MRIAELSRRSGVGVATIKYYLREGVLPAGQRTSPNQANYDDTHVHRLRLVRALVDVGGLSIAAVRGVLDSVDQPEPDVTKTLGALQMAVFPPQPATDEPARAAATEKIVALLDDLGWNSPLDHPAIQTLAATLETATTLGHGRFLEILPRYAVACAAIAEADLDYVATAPTLDDVVESAVVGTALGDTALAALRRLAHVRESKRRFNTDE